MKFSIEAEQGVIGGLLINPAKLDDVLEIVSPEDFYRADNKIIMTAICQMADKGEAIDAITLAEMIMEQGNFERIGGLPYLIELAQQTEGVANIKAYSRIVADRAMDRKIYDSGLRICELGQADGDVDEKLNTLHAELEAIERKDDSGFVEFKSVMKACIQRIDDKHKGKTVDTVKTGFSVVDERLIIEPTDLWVVAARPAMGKTIWAMNVAYNVAKTGKEVIVFSMEMSKEQLTDRLLCASSGLSTDLIRSGKLLEDDWRKLEAGAVKLHGLKIHIIEIPAIDINRALAIARKFAKRGNVGLVVIDYLQLMTASGDKRFDVVSEVSRKLKVMAKTIKAPVLALSQLSRKCDERADSRPVMSDLRESGQIEQDADIISFIYRDEVYHEDTPNKGVAELITRKFRNGEIGTDLLATQFQYSRFADLNLSEYSYNWQPQKETKRRAGFN